MHKVWCLQQYDLPHEQRHMHFDTNGGVRIDMCLWRWAVDVVCTAGVCSDPSCSPQRAGCCCQRHCQQVAVPSWTTLTPAAPAAPSATPRASQESLLHPLGPWNPQHLARLAPHALPSALSLSPYQGPCIL
jgi:hypothetical protein